MEKKPVAHRHVFTPEEDARLKLLVKQFGEKSWQVISCYMPGRSQRQCKERYEGYLKPEIKNLPWSKEEDEILIEKYKIYGRKWAKISRFFNGRSNSNVKNRWKSLLMVNTLVQDLDKGNYIAKDVNDGINSEKIEKKELDTENIEKNETNADSIERKENTIDDIDSLLTTSTNDILLNKEESAELFNDNSNEIKLPVIRVSPSLINPMRFWDSNQTEREANLTFKNESNPIENVGLYKNYGGKIW